MKQPASAAASRAPDGQLTTSNRVLAVAARLIREKGYAGTTTREIAEAAGLQKASLYHHIQSKEQLLYELSRDSLDRIQSNVAILVAREDDPLHRLRAAIVAHVTTMLDDQDKHATMLLELRSLTGERRREIIRQRDAYEEMLEATLRECQQAGCIREDREAGVLVMALLNLLNWTIFWYRPGGDLTPQEVADLLQSIYLDGVSLRPSHGATADVPLAGTSRPAKRRGRSVTLN